MASPRYALTGPNNAAAVDAGLADAEWWQPHIDAAVLRDLQERSNGRATRDTVLWLALTVGFGVLAYLSMWSWWSIPAFLAYGGLYGGAADSRWHECGHGTAFRRSLANDIVYYLACFMLLRGPTVWRWSHYRHHTDTVVVGRDIEIVFERPTSPAQAAFAYLHLQGSWGLFTQLVRHAAGRIDPAVIDFVPPDERRKVVWESRAYLAVLAVVVAVSLGFWTVVPILFIGLPTVYGGWLVVFFGITQHAGLTENVLDHRLNTRTVKMNPVFRFLYSNMNYHVEHHLFPSVPYRNLPRLHAAIADQLAPAWPTTWSAYRHIFGTLAAQKRDPSFEATLDVPDVPSAARSRIDVGVELWHDDDGSIDLGTVDDLGVGELRRVDVADGTYVLARLDEDKFCLADGLCTHQKVHLAGGAIVDGQFECPKHNARFDCHTGEPTRKPARRPIAVHHLERVGGRLVGRIETPTSEETTQ